MKLQCKAYRNYCSLEIFTINNAPADYDDFGEKEDVAPYAAEEYGCGCMKFIAKEPTQEVLAKYDITIDEYYAVCDKLSEELSFGACCACA